MKEDIFVFFSKKAVCSTWGSDATLFSNYSAFVLPIVLEAQESYIHL